MRPPLVAEATTRARSPWAPAFRAETALPAAVFGPVEIQVAAPLPAVAAGVRLREGGRLAPRKELGEGLRVGEQQVRQNPDLLDDVPLDLEGL